MLDYQGIMIDLETFGTRPGCVVAQIGACAFSDKGVGDQFYASIDLESCTQWGLQFEPRTVLWWMEQSQDARDFIIRGSRTPLDVALDELRKAFKWKGKEVWCNGQDFDFPILQSAFDATGKSVPWEYWAKNDYRTIKKRIPRDVYETLKVTATVKHNALADAVSQAETLIRMLRHLNGVPAKGQKRVA